MYLRNHLQAVEVTKGMPQPPKLSFDDDDDIELKHQSV
jgi:hypothetical protein